MEGDKSHNTDNAFFVVDEGHPTPSNESPINLPSTEATSEPEL